MDKLARKQSARWPAARRRPLTDAENVDGEVSFEPPSRFTSLYHLVGAGEQCRWHFEAERLGSRQIDDEIELGRLLYWKVAGLGTAQDLVDVVGGAPEQIRIAWSVRHQTARFDKLLHGADCCHSRDVGQGVDANPIAV